MLRSLNRLINYYRVLGDGERSYKCIKVEDPETLLEVQRLHARRYFARGYVKPEEIDKRGVLDVKGDPYQKHADYFAVINKNTHKVVAGARLIYPMPHETLDDFQALKHFRVYGQSRKYVHKFNPEEVREVSALVKTPGEGPLPTLMLYRAMWQYSFINEHRAWVVGCNADLYKSLYWLFGAAVRRIGPLQKFRNHLFIPSLFEIVPSFNNLLHESKTLNPVKRLLKRRLVRFFLKGLSTNTMTARQQKAIKQWYAVTKYQPS